MKGQDVGLPTLFALLKHFDFTKWSGINQPSSFRDFQHSPQNSQISVNGRSPVVQAMIQAAPEKIKKAALAMFVPQGYSIDSDRASELKISRPWSSEEISSYNTDHWTIQPVSNCRDVHTFILLSGDHAITVTMHWDTVCGVDGGWKIWNRDNEKILS